MYVCTYATSTENNTTQVADSATQVLEIHKTHVQRRDCLNLTYKKTATAALISRGYG